MAKQSGLHQLRGKIGEHSYYKQSGVSSGLVRSINQGMSSRVKTSPEFENTRRNNAEFKLATKAGADLLNAVMPKYRPMFNLFRNARTSAALLELAKQTAAPWGERHLVTAQRPQVADIMTAASKSKLSELVGISFDTDEGVVSEIIMTPTASMDDILASFGADGVIISYYGVRAYLTNPQDALASGELAENVIVFGDVSDYEIAADESDPQVVSMSVPSRDLNLLTGRVELPFIYVIAMPYRTINGTNYILQEACRFGVFVDPSDMN